MSIAEISVCPTKPRVPVAALLGRDACTDEFTWETREELLRYARARLGQLATTRLEEMRARGVGPDEDPEPTKYDSDPREEAWEDVDPYP